MCVGQRSRLLTPHQGPQHRRPPLERDQGRQDGEGAVEEAGGAEAGDGAADDQHGGGGGEAADQGADLEQEQEGDVGPLVVEVGEELARAGLEGRPVLC